MPEPEPEAPMHHPHISEDVKSFGKHLFATFLGLLMALGLESCHQRSLQAARAENAMIAVRAELESNRKEMITSLESLQRNSGRLRKILSAADALKQNKPMPEDKLEFTLDLLMADLPSAAWDAAVSAQVVHHVPFERIQALSQIYRSQRRVEPQHEALIESLMRLNLSAQSAGSKFDLQSLKGTAALGELSTALKTVLFRMEALRQIQKGILDEMDTVLKTIKK